MSHTVGESCYFEGLSKWEMLFLTSFLSLFFVLFLVHSPSPFLDCFSFFWSSAPPFYSKSSSLPLSPPSIFPLLSPLISFSVSSPSYPHFSPPLSIPLLFLSFTSPIFLHHPSSHSHPIGCCCWGGRVWEIFAVPGRHNKKIKPEGLDWKIY